MDSKTQTKNIEIQLANRLQESMAEISKSLQVQAKNMSEGTISLNTMDMGNQTQTQKNPAELLEANFVKKAIGDSQKSTVVRDQNKSQTYEKLLNEGTKNTESQQADKLLLILDEVSSQKAALNSQIQNPNFVRPVLVTQAENLEMDFSKLKNENEEENENSNHSFQDEEDEEEAECCGDDEETTALADSDHDYNKKTISLKDTDPEYYKTLITKI